LDGHQSGSILNQVVWINSDQFTKTDEGSIPTGELVDVTNTPMDFRTPTVVGDRIDADYEQLNFAGGYDHNWKINRSQAGFEKAASIYSPDTGIKMEVSTTLPGIQVYAGNYLGGSVDKLGKDQAVYDKRSGICFETQYFPNCINIPEFESCVFGGKEKYCHTTVFKFSVIE
jgi:aldose 1-epimerase